MDIKESGENRDLIKFIDDKLFKQAKEWKFYYSGDKHEKWLDDIRFVKGIQWPSLVPNERTSVVINRIWSNIQKELPFMTDNPPKIYVEPAEQSDKLAADIIKQMLNTAWLQRDMERKLPEGTLHAKEVGTCFYRPFWNAQLADGLGDIDCEVLDPLEAFPFAYTDELTMDRCEGFIWARNVSMGWIKKNYPKEGWRVQAQVDSSIVDRCKETNMATDESHVRQVSDMGAGSSYTASETHYFSGGTGTSLSDKDLNKVTLIKCFIKDGSTKDVEDPKTKEKKSELKYPYGRMICIAGGVVLSDEPWAFKFFPYVSQVNYIQASEFWGESDVKQIKDSQKLYNKIVSMLSDAVSRGIYTTKFLQKGSGIDADQFYVSKDSIYETKIPNPVSELTPQALPPQVFSFPQFIETSIEKTFGMGDIGSVQNPSQLPSGRSLAEYQEITQTRLRQKIRNLEDTVRHIATAWMEMILANYTERRIMRLKNPQTQGQEYVYVFNQKDPGMAQEEKTQAESETIEGTEQKDPQGQPIPNSGQKKYKYVLNMADIKGGFDLNVATGSTVSVSKFATFDQAALLYKMGAIDRAALLEAADFPNREEIANRMDQQAQMAQQAQSQATQAEAQGKMQETQMKGQTDMAKTKLQSDTDIFIEKMKQAGIQDTRIKDLENILTKGG